MIRFLPLILAFLATSAFATCMSTCRDTDAGLDPEYAGVGIVLTQCSAPGGPVHRSEQFFFDSCENNVHTEVVCAGMPGGEWMKLVKFECKQCSPIREGVCLEVGSVIE
jgi:hypothetical protein